MVQIAIIGAALVIVGIVVAWLGSYQLGMARAARKWESAERTPRVGRGMATTFVIVGLLLLAGGTATLTALVKFPGQRPGGPIIIGLIAAVVILVLGMYGAAKIADRVELNALIRTPSRFRRVPAAEAQPATGKPEGASPETDSVVPPTARPGWVYRDTGGAWYLVVAAGAGCRLVSLPDFKLVPTNLVKPPVTAAGSVELAVWPLSETPGVREGEAHQAAT
jgi:hypothetical protein